MFWPFKFKKKEAMENDLYTILNVEDHTAAHFPQEVLIKIFSGLMVPDLLSVSQVCKPWCDVIARPTFLKLIRLRSDERVVGRTLNHMWEMLKETNRNYQNLAVFNVPRGSIMNLKEQDFEWKSLVLNGCTFNSTSELIDLLKSVKETIVELNFDHMIYACDYRDVIDKYVDMPKLRDLTVDCIYCSDDENILNILKPNFGRLTSLKMAYNFFTDRFMKLLPAEIKLTTLHLNQSMNASNMKPLEPFLLRQAPSLIDVRFDSITSSTFELIWNECINMKKLTIGNKKVVLESSNLNLKKHPTLIELRFQMVVPNSVLNTVFQAVPQLKFLYLPEMDNELILMATEKLTNLQYLHVWTLKGELKGTDKKFANLKRARVFQYIAVTDGPLKRMKNSTYQEQTRLLMEMLR
ncbi:unnamed protein product [Diamesa serratosioi]